MPTQQRPASQEAPVPTRASVVSIQIHPPEAALPRRRIGTAEFTDGTVAEVALQPNTGAILVHFGEDSPWYAYMPEELATGALRIHPAGGGR